MVRSRWFRRRSLRRTLLVGLAAVLALFIAACSGRTTGAAQVTSSSAQLNAEGSCERQCSYFFRYGLATDSGYPNTTRVVSGVGNTNGATVRFAETVNSLQAGTDYRYQACGKESDYSDYICVGPTDTNSYSSFTTATAGDPVIAAAGDIACNPSDPNYHGGAGTSTACQQRATSDLLVNQGLSQVLALGDDQYDCAGTSALTAFDASWGRVKSIIRPAPGNHEYASGNDIYDGHACSPSATPYYDYFGSAAGDPSKGYYSFDVGNWHLVALNTGNDSVCSPVACVAGSAQEQWLKADLAASSKPCTLAFFHVPLFSSRSAKSSEVKPFWNDLYAAGAEIVLDGHVHDYERFAPQTPAAAANANGIREFVVGTGGKSQDAVSTTPAANSELQGKAFGVLKLTLRSSSYDWQYVPAAGSSFTDSGTTACH